MAISKRAGCSFPAFAEAGLRANLLSVNFAAPTEPWRWFGRQRAANAGNDSGDTDLQGITIPHG
jgi:hypothetical protein